MPDDKTDLNRTRNLVYLLFGLPCLAILIILATCKEQPPARQKSDSDIALISPTKKGPVDSRTAQEANPFTSEQIKSGVRVRLLRIANVTQFAATDAAPESLLELIYLVEKISSEAITETNQGPVSLLDAANRRIQTPLPAVDRRFAFHDEIPSWIPELPHVTNPHQSYLRIQQILLPKDTVVHSCIIREGFDGTHYDFHFTFPSRH